MDNREELYWLDDAKPFYLGKVPLIESGHIASALARRRAHDQIVKPNPLPGSFQVRPNSRMFISGLLRIGNNRKRLQNGFYVKFPGSPMRPSRPFHSAPEFCRSYGRDFKFIIRTGGQPVLQAERASCSLNKNVRA